MKSMFWNVTLVGVKVVHYLIFAIGIATIAFVGLFGRSSITINGGNAYEFVGFFVDPEDAGASEE